jgi:hypothetical protein
MSATNYGDPLARDPAILGTTTPIIGGGIHTHRRISWAAIFGGVILVVAVQLLLSMLAAGIGLGTVNVNAGSTPNASSLGIGAGIWWVVSSMIALGFGGYVAAWLAGIELRWDGVLHGLVTWGIATLLTIYLLSTAIGGVVGGGFSLLGSVTAAAGSGVKDAAQPLAQAAGVSPDMLQQQAQAYLKSANSDPATMTPQDAQKEAAASLATYAKGGPDAPAAKQRVIAIMAAQQHITTDEAAQQFDANEAKVKQARDEMVQKAKNAADESASAASKTAFAGFGVLLLGAIAAAIGGSFAVQRRLQVTQRIGR